SSRRPQTSATPFPDTTLFRSGLMPHRTVAQNIGMVCQLVGWDSGRIRARVTELAAMLELDPELLGRYPPELSGGQRQRVGVAREIGRAHVGTPDTRRVRMPTD